MKDHTSIFELLGNTIQNAIDTVNADSNLKLRELCDALQLDPKNDFKHCDLSDVDFSNSDLRGFNFTGSDLSGSFGINVLIDKTTVLIGCDTAGSLFSSRRRREEFFKSQDNEREYQLFKENEWSNTIISAGAYLGVNTDVNKLKKPTRKGILFCERLLYETNDSTVRNNILFSMSNAKSNSDEYFELLLGMLAVYANNERLVRSALTIMADFFYDKRAAIGIFVWYLRTTNRSTLTAAVKGIARSRYFSEAAADVVRAIAGRDKYCVYLRQTLLSEVAKRKGHEYRESLTEYQGTVIDYETPIDEDILVNIAKRSLFTKKADTAAQNRRSYETISVSRQEIEAELPNIEARLRDLAKLGIPFRITH
jgi:hypothetical protein